MSDRTGSCPRCDDTVPLDHRQRISHHPGLGKPICPGSWSRPKSHVISKEQS